MLPILSWSNLSTNEQKQQLKRAVQKNPPVAPVAKIIANVKAQGDKALMQYSREFDGVELSRLSVSREKITKAEVSTSTLAAIQSAIETITLFHTAVMPRAMRVNTAKGIFIDCVYRPINTVGLYVPGGNNTPLISSVLMQAIPAMIAGCPQRVLCTPPNKKGEIDAAILVAARLCKIDTIYPIGGAQAIAAMAYGTESVMKVDKIFGPGNSWVTEAKTQVSIDPESTNRCNTVALSYAHRVRK